GVPYVITTQLGDVPGAIPDQTDHLFRWLNPLIRPVWHGAAAVTTVSSFVADLAHRAYGVRPILIPNGVNLAGRPRPPRQLNPSPRLLFVGRLNPQKNLPFLIELLGELKHLPWTLDVVGDGQQRLTLADLAERGGIGRRVRFHGWLGRTEVDAMLAGSEILVFPSLVEGLPLALLEGLKFGLALAASDLPPLRELVETGQNGILITPGDRDAWIVRVRDLINDPTRVLQMRQAGWALANQFDLERITDRYEAVFADVLGSPRPEFPD
ncbi:MAG TPA: glycosyltransferase family 4 protein, partial [Chthoniobacterales bacterium]